MRVQIRRRDEITRIVLRWATPMRILTLAASLTAVALTAGILYYGYKAKPGWMGVANKELWDYLDLLIVPVALAIGVAWLNGAQRKRERAAEEEQQKRERDAEEAQQARERVAEEARRERELAIEEQRSQDAALQTYLDKLT
jgi:hypothetical protein